MGRINDSDSCSITNLMMREVARTKVLTREEEQSLFQRYKTASVNERDAIRNTIVRANLRFVLNVALHYNKMLGVDVNDLMSEGKIGLILAVDKFNPDRGLKFISFAVWHIRCHVSKFLEENDLIRLPSGQKMKLNKLRKMDPEQIDDESKLLLQMVDNYSSIDSPVNGETDLYLRDILHDENAVNGESHWIDSRIRTDLNQIMQEVLNDEERFVISSIFGLKNGGETMTLKETNECIGKSRERVRQIRDRALKKLKRNVNIQDLNEILHEAKF